MNQQISPQDWQRLSDYLDHQLSSTELAQVEKDMVSRPELKEACSALLINQKMLRALPRKRSPKNFTLSIQSLPKPRASRFLFPAFSAASAVFTLIFLFSLFYQGLMPTQSMKTQAEAEAPMLAMAPAPMAAEGAADAVNTQAAPVVYWGSPPQALPDFGMGGMGGGNNLSTESGIPPSTADSARDLKAAPAAESSASDYQFTAPEIPYDLTSPMEGNGPILGVQPTNETDQETGHSPDLPGVFESSPTPSTSENFPLIPIISATLAILSGLTALFVWFRNQL